MTGAIWAQSIDRVIGDGEQMPWHIPEDLAHFKQVTMGSPVIMGRRTWESLPPSVRPLPGRDNYVLSTREPGDWSTGATVVQAIPDLDHAWVMGGAAVYEEAVRTASVIEVTLIDAHLTNVYGSRAVFAPEIPEDFTLVDESDWQTSGGWRFRFLRYER